MADDVRSVLLPRPLGWGLGAPSEAKAHADTGAGADTYARARHEATVSRSYTYTATHLLPVAHTATCDVDSCTCFVGSGADDHGRVGKDRLQRAGGQRAARHLPGME